VVAGVLPDAIARGWCAIGRRAGARRGRGGARATAEAKAGVGARGCDARAETVARSMHAERGAGVTNEGGVE